MTEVVNEWPAAAHKPEQFLDYHELLVAIKSGAIKVDLVVLTTPSGLHPSQAIAAAEVGVHVHGETYGCWEEGVAMVKACDASGVRLFAVKQNRFNSTLQLVKRQVEAGRFGQIAMVSVNVGSDPRVIMIKTVGGEHGPQRRSIDESS